MTNRLWVRFSLVFLVFSFLVIFATFLFRVVLGEAGGAPFDDPQIRAAVAALPPETVALFAQQIREDALSGISSVLLASTVVGLGVSVLLSRWLTRPLDELAAGARALEAQDYTYRVPVDGSVEVAEVATAFNRMAARLEEAEGLRRNLLADVTHELRHPVHVLRGNLQAMLDDVYPLTKEEIGRLHAQTELLASLVNDLRDLAQAEAHLLPLQPTTVDIGALVKESVRGFQPAASGKGVGLQVALQGRLSPLSVDPTRLQQIIHNLVDNALTHTPAGGRVDVTVEERDGAILIAVADSGAGMSADELPHVFDRFYRADTARRRDQGGAGLGLAIARALVEAHEGDITATSAGVGQGSTFTVALPLSSRTG